MSRDSFNEVPMGCPWQHIGQPHADIPGLIQALTGIAVQVPQPTTMKTGAVSINNCQENIRGSKVELLREGVHLTNEVALLHSNVLSHTIVRLQLVAKMLHCVNPWEGILIQKNGENVLPGPYMLAEH